MKHKLQECIDWIRSQGVGYADGRFVRAEHEDIHVSNDGIDVFSRTLDAGVGIRVLHKGCWGFAATADCSSSALKRTARTAMQIAAASAMTRGTPVTLADQEAYVDTYQSPCKKDPFEVPTEKKLDLLFRTADVLMAGKQIKRANASMTFIRTHKLFVSTEGALIEQDFVESGAGCSAVASDGRDTQSRSSGGTTRGDNAARGYEHIEALGLPEEAVRIRTEAAGLLKAPPCPSGDTTVVLGGHMMAMQIHESCGHPSELDRVLGTEISLAGGSFMTLDQLGKRKYGSKFVNLYADATIPGSPGSFGYDDEGVPAQRSPIVTKGIHVGYLTSRETAPVVGQHSNGTMRADGWNNLPLVRMTNINLAPGSWEFDDLIKDTKKGIYFDANASVSIDDQRLNFQFTGECAWEIKNGRAGADVQKSAVHGHHAALLELLRRGV